MVITSVETCVPDSQDDEEEKIHRREVKVEVENLNTSRLSISPEVPTANVIKRLILAKKNASGSVYKIVNEKKLSKNRKPLVRCKSNALVSCLKPDKTKTFFDFSCGLCSNKFGCRFHLYEHYSLLHFKDQLRPFIDEEGRQRRGGEWRRRRRLQKH